MQTFLIDSHCHLDEDFGPKTPEAMVAEAAQHGVKYLVTIGTEPPHFEKLQKIADQFENVFFTAGVHPHETSKVGKGDLEKLRNIAQHPKCRAIGEVGLDYFYLHSPKDAQTGRLSDQLEIALDLKLPIVIHSRDGEMDLLPALEKYAARCSGKPGVIHCFTGSYAFGKSCIDLGFFVSISGIITFKKSTELRETVRKFPLDRLMVETDSPFLAPEPFRGKKCEPYMVKWTAQKLAELFQESFEKVAELTSKNTMELFKLK